MDSQIHAIDPLVIVLSPEPGLTRDLKNAVQALEHSTRCDVLLDFSRVGMVTSASLASLLQLRQRLADECHRLVLCRVSPATQGIFVVTHLDRAFEFCDDRRGVSNRIPIPTRPRLRAIWP